MDTKKIIRNSVVNGSLLISMLIGNVFWQQLLVDVCISIGIFWLILQSMELQQNVILSNMIKPLPEILSCASFLLTISTLFYCSLYVRITGLHPNTLLSSGESWFLTNNVLVMTSVRLCVGFNLACALGILLTKKQQVYYYTAQYPLLLKKAISKLPR